MLGGMWGFKSFQNRPLANEIYSKIINKELSQEYNKEKNAKMSDQYFLWKHVYPIVKTDALAHDSYYCNKYGGIPFPTKRIESCFVGGMEGHYELDTCKSNYTFVQNASFYICPKECRPKDHQDWITC